MLHEKPFDCTSMVVHGSHYTSQSGPKIMFAPLQDFPPRDWPLIVCGIYRSVPNTSVSGVRNRKRVWPHHGFAQILCAREHEARSSYGGHSVFLSLSLVTTICCLVTTVASNRRNTNTCAVLFYDFERTKLLDDRQHLLLCNPDVKFPNNNINLPTSLQTLCLNT